MINLEKILKELYNNSDYVSFENDTYVLNSRYKIGRVELKGQHASLELLTKSSQKIFIDNNKLNGAYQDDIVLAQVLFNPKGKTKAKVIKLLSPHNSSVLGYIKENKFYSIKEGVNVEFKIDKSLYKEGDVLLIKENTVLECFGNINDAKVDEKISLYLFNEYNRLEKKKVTIDTVFPDKAKRTNLTHLAFCTIDPVSAKDHDDAIYYDEDKTTLYVAIADVSAFVKEGTLLDEEARRKSFSVYLPHKVLPMLPFELSNDLCSLVPNQDRLAYVFKMKLNIKETKVESSEVFEAVIQSHNKYSYEYIDEVLKIENKDDQNVKLYNVTKKFRKKRLKNGYDFRNEEIRLVLDGKDEFEQYKVESSSPSHSLVEECMLLANQEAAKKLKTMGIFRVHGEPTQTKISKLIDEVNALGIKSSLKSDVHSTIISIQQKAKNVGLEHEVDELIIQSQQQAHYSSTKKEHFGLGFSDYSHFTSPIRRYSDLVLHRILKSKKIPDDIEEICVRLSEQERQIASLVWDFEDRKYARWGQKNIGTIINAKLVDTQKSLVKANEIIKGARILINNYSGEKLFSDLDIEIISSDIVTKIIVAKIVTKKENFKKKY